MLQWVNALKVSDLILPCTRFGTQAKIKQKNKRCCHLVVKMDKTLYNALHYQ